MLQSAKSLLDYVVKAIDGNIGKVNNIYFDDQNWILRYVVIDIGLMFSDRIVLLSTSILKKPLTMEHLFPVSITKQQIWDSPDITTNLPISRVHEIALHDYFGWPYYWDISPFINTEPLPVADIAKENIDIQSKTVEKSDTDNHLQSFLEIKGYRIEAENGMIGHIDDVIIDESEWKISSVVVDTSNWFHGKKVLLPSYSFRSFNWSDRSAQVFQTRAQIQSSPSYDPSFPVNKEMEERLYDYYGRPKE